LSSRTKAEGSLSSKRINGEKLFILRRGFTLIELVTVLIVVGILTTLALPMFVKTMETTRAQEAVVALRQIRAAERIYRMQENFYYPHHTDHPAPETVIATINHDLRTLLDTRTNRNWNYSVDANTSDTFTAAATRTSGRNSGETITIDQGGDMGGTWSP
jgi:prepilin-type N-terminal cleavage/methylation domain-containing protein